MSDLLTDLFKAAPKRISFGEEGASGDEGEGKTPWERLSPEEQQAARDMGTTVEEYNEINKDNVPDFQGEEK